MISEGVANTHNKQDRNMKEKTIVLHWPSFGPYHTARLMACAEQAPPGVRVVGLAVAGQVQGRPWVADQMMERVEVVTLFPEAMYHELDPSAVKVAMRRSLEELSARAVGISGYGMVDSRAALRWCVQKRVPRILMTESKADDAPRVWWKEWLKRRLVGKFGSGLCGGTPHRAYLEQLGMPAGRIRDRYDVVDNQRFRQAVEEVRRAPGRWRHLPGLSHEGRYFLASSRMIERKNLRGLLEAYRGYSEATHAPWPLILLGTGPEEDSLREQAASLRQGQVVFAGFRQFDELVAYYAFAGAFIHPALQEQWGLVINEAMSCGLPVLSSRTAGAAHDLVTHGGNGFLFDPMVIREMKDAMLAMSGMPEDEWRAFSERSLERISSWTPEDFGRNFWSAARAAGLDA